jgi:hypothetical protein
MAQMQNMQIFVAIGLSLFIILFFLLWKNFKSKDIIQRTTENFHQQQKISIRKKDVSVPDLLSPVKQKYCGTNPSKECVSANRDQIKDECDAQLTQWICEKTKKVASIYNSCKLNGVNFICTFLGENDSRCKLVQNACLL